MIKSLCIYCASSALVDQKYKDLARDVARVCAENGVEIVYGGGHVGLMGIVADAALAHGGRIIGVIPEFLKDMEVAHSGLSALHVTKTMQERQYKMAELADGFLILPGGMGTLAEFFEIVTWKSLKLHDKPIVVLNAYGYWDSLLAMLQTGYKEKFIRQKPEVLFDIIPDFNVFKTQFFRFS